jgi:hypothetical protein
MRYLAFHTLTLLHISRQADLNRSESSQMHAGFPRRTKNEKMPRNWGRALEQFSESKSPP